jgi:dienelactone hydrolase
MRKGTVKFEPVGDESKNPERYRLEAHEFPYEMKLLHDYESQGYEVWELRYPSPVETSYPENNMVYAEFYRPKGAGPFPGVVVLDILAGDQTLARLQASILAQNKIAALFVQMAYYGPRRPKTGYVRLLSPNIDHTLNAIRQTVLDVRRAGAWLAAQPEIDKDRLGILGTSLGSFMGSLSAEMEPRFKRVALLLGGGGLVDAFYDNPQAGPLRKIYEGLGGSKEKLAEKIACADPLTCAANLKDRQVIMFGAKRDDVVPPKATETLWEAIGKPKIVWYDCTHTGAVLYIVPAMQAIITHFSAP